MATLKTIVEKLKNLSHDLIIIANSDGQLELRVTTDTLRVQTRFKHLQLNQKHTSQVQEDCDPADYHQIMVDARDFVKFLPCQVIHPDQVTLSIRKDSIVVDAFLLGDGDPVAKLTFSIPNKSD